MTVRRVLFLCAVLLASALRAPIVFASCRQTTPAGEYASSTIVFAGLPLSVERLVSDDPEFIGNTRFLVTFLVTTVRKGVVGDTIVLRTESDRYEPGHLYLYYIRTTHLGFAHQYARYRGLGPFFVAPCSGGGRAEYALWTRYWLPEPLELRPGPKPSRVTLRELLAALASHDERMRFSASQALGQITEARSEILPELRRMLVGKEPGDPVAVARAVGLMREAGRPAEPELAWALSNSSGEGRAAAQADSFRRYLSLALSDTSTALLAKACDAAELSAGSWPIAERETVERRLLVLVRLPVPSVRANAVSAIGHFRTAGMTILGTIDSLRKHDPDQCVRGSARGSWRKLTGLDPWEGLPKGSMRGRGWPEAIAEGASATVNVPRGRVIARFSASD